MTCHAVVTLIIVVAIMLNNNMGCKLGNDNQSLRGTYSYYVLLTCELFSSPLARKVSKLICNELGGNEKVLRIMDSACCDEAVARAVEVSGRSVLLQMLPFLTRLDS